MPVIRRSLPTSGVEPTRPDVATIPFPNQQLLRVSQAAMFLGASQWAVRDLVRKRKLIPIIIGNRHHYDRRDLLAFIERAKAAA